MKGLSESTDIVVESLSDMNGPGATMGHWKGCSDIVGPWQRER